MEIQLVIVLVFGIVISFIHITGICILTKSRDRNVCGTQKYLVIALSLTELGFVILSTIREFIYNTRGSRSDNIGLWLAVYILIVIMSMYYFIMFAITLDRFFEIRLDIKYHLYSNKKTTKKVLISVYIALNVFYMTLLFIYLAYRQPAYPANIIKNFILFFAPVIDTIFVIFAIIVYSYIFSKLDRNRRKDDALRIQLAVNEPNVPIILKADRFRVPFWIVLTFVLFLIFPDILELIRKTLLHPSLQDDFQMLSYVLYRIGFIVDPIIYIYNLESVQYKLRKVLHQIKR